MQTIGIERRGAGAGGAIVLSAEGTAPVLSARLVVVVLVVGRRAGVDEDVDAGVVDGALEVLVDFVVVVGISGSGASGAFSRGSVIFDDRKAAEFYRVAERTTATSLGEKGVVRGGRGCERGKGCQERQGCRSSAKYS